MRHDRVGARLVVLFVAGLVLTACGTAGRGPGQVVVARGDVARADVPRSNAAVPIDRVVDGMLAFGHDLIATTDASSRNTVLSPLSIELAFAMARVGAGGTTAAQIDRVLHLPAQDRDAAFNALTRNLITTNSPPPSPATPAARSQGGPPAAPVVAIANALFVQSGLRVGQPFLHTLAADYGEELRSVDFSSGDGAKAVNDWVRRQTADRIQRLFDSLDPATQLVIANAVYLKADWANPFAERTTTDEPFLRADGSTIVAPTMHQEGSYRYAEAPGWQAVELPYAGGDLVMRVLVPSGPGNPADLLTPTTMTEVSHGLHAERVSLALPRWDFGTVVDLVGALGRLGLRAPFADDADFSGISPDLPISGAVHRANITVDEWGTEAAAVTGLAFRASALPAGPAITVTADHPFAFAVLDRSSGAPLFIGTVADPSAARPHPPAG
jgi:serpin B